MSEIPDMERRLREFAAAPDDGDWNDVMRRAGERLPSPRFTRRRLAVALAAAVVVAGSLAVLLPGHSTRSSAPAGRHGPTAPSGPIGPGGETHAGGDVPQDPIPERKISMRELRVEAPWIPLPDSELANDSNAGDAWVLDGVWPSLSSERFAHVYYPTSRITLSWSENGIGVPDPLVINGVPARFIPGNGKWASLYLDVLPTRGLLLQGPLTESELIAVAQTLNTDATSPGEPLPPADPSTPPGDTFNGPVGYWWEPGVLFHAVSADSVAAAGESLAFQPVAPSALGNPTSILQTDPASAPASDRVLSLRYDDPSLGRFWLLERPSGSVTTSLLRTGAYDCPPEQPDCVHTASMVDLGGVSGLSMLLGKADRIVWVENGIYFEVIGPPTFFTPAALSVAKTVAAAAAG